MFKFAYNRISESIDGDHKNEWLNRIHSVSFEENKISAKKHSAWNVLRNLCNNKGFT